MGKISDKFLGAFNLKEEDTYRDEYDDYEDEPKKDKGLFKRNNNDRPAEEKQSLFSRATSKSVTRVTKTGQQEVCIFKPSSIEDSREITETLLQGKAVIVNFEGLHVEISQRIIDFISGSCYALDGNLQKISNYIFIATPASVDISGDFQELFESNDAAFDIAGFKSPLL